MWYYGAPGGRTECMSCLKHASSSEPCWNWSWWKLSSFILWLKINPKMDLRLKILFVSHAAGLQNNLYNKRKKSGLIQYKSSSCRYWNIIGLLSETEKQQRGGWRHKTLQRQSLYLWLSVTMYTDSLYIYRQSVYILTVYILTVYYCIVILITHLCCSNVAACHINSTKYTV